MTLKCLSRWLRLLNVGGLHNSTRVIKSFSREVTKHPVLWTRTMLHRKSSAKQGIKYFFGSFISTFLWYLCIYRSESKNQNENFKYHIYCIHVLNGFVKMNCMLPLKALKYILLVCNKIKVNGKKLSYILLLFKHIVQHIWLWISIWTFSSTWSICFISLNVSMQNLQRNVFFFTLNFKRGHYCQFTFWQMCLFNSLCTIWRLGCAKHISDTC